MLRADRPSTVTVDQLRHLDDVEDGVLTYGPDSHVVAQSRHTRDPERDVVLMDRDTAYSQLGYDGVTLADIADDLTASLPAIVSNAITEGDDL